MRQLATALNNRPSRSLPSDTEVPRIQGREEVKLIELKSGKSLEPMKITKQPMKITKQPLIITDPNNEKLKGRQGSIKQYLEDKQRQPSLSQLEQDLSTATLPPRAALDDHV
ncbi:hypothetical protein QN277_005053 [Acacia crassicarpa]|uniref:Uncharacterized protein n=1 Tax=Acacia crassicarpa TaxID=499986 RepID=A0AAE1M9E1_9FABA|nr:hypothetical protein QN277_005053 [Acacia crassicarpa]